MKLSSSWLALLAVVTGEVVGSSEEGVFRKLALFKYINKGPLSLFATRVLTRCDRITINTCKV